MPLRLLPIFSSTNIGNAGQELNGYLCHHRATSPEMGETLLWTQAAQLWHTYVSEWIHISNNIDKLWTRIYTKGS
jgi:hypothetical protein